MTSLGRKKKLGKRWAKSSVFNLPFPTSFNSRCGPLPQSQPCCTFMFQQNHAMNRQRPFCVSGIFHEPALGTMTRGIFSWLQICHLTARCHKIFKKIEISCMFDPSVIEAHIINGCELYHGKLPSDVSHSNTA